MPEDQDLVAEYRTCFDQVQASISRRWQSVTITGGIYVVAGVAFGTLLPAATFDGWIKIVAVWVAVAILTVANVVFGVSVLSEIHWQTVAMLRGIQIEERLGYRLMTATAATITRPWEDSSSAQRDVWMKLDDAARDEIGAIDRVLDRFPLRKQSSYRRLLIMTLATLEFGVFACAIVVTIGLLSHGIHR